MEEDQIVRLFREMCGEYYPEELENYKRFTLTVDDVQVPVFVDSEHKTLFPQIQITPFVGNREYHVDQQQELGLSDDSLDNPEYTYLLSDRSIHFNEAKFAVAIYATDFSQLIEIKKALKRRFWLFLNTELGEFLDTENFVLDEETGIYSSTEYNDSLINFARIEEIVNGETEVLVNDEQLSEAGTWFLDEQSLSIYPYADMENIKFIEIIYGLVFNDGFCTKEKGLKQLDIETSTKGSDTNPDIDRWTMMLKLKFRDVENKTVGRSFAEVEVDAQED